MSVPKLVYFGIFARAESTRMVLAHARALYDDERLSFEEFGVKKAAGEFTNGQVPVWIQDGVQYCESLAILRFVGRQYGYYPPEYHDQWACDSLVDWSNDFLGQVAKIVFFEKRFDSEGEKDFLEIVSKMTAYLAKKLSAHGKDFLIGDKITIADFHVASILFSATRNEGFAGGKAWCDKAKAVIAANSVVNGWHSRMEKQLEEYLAVRPPAPF